MKNMTLKNIAASCGGRLVGGREDLEIAGAVMDSRQVERDFLFFAIKGERADGHDFIQQVMEKGAACAVCEREPEIQCGAYILVEDVPKAMQDIAAFYRRELSIPVVGITGSVGKTSTKEFIAAVLGEKYNVLKTCGNYNNELGVPLTLFRIREEHEAAVVEMGINHFGEMHRLSRMAAPDIVVMTNIGDCHLEALGSRAGILKAKSEIFDFSAEDGTVILNGDDDMLSTIKKTDKETVVMFGKSTDNDYYAADIHSKGLFGTEAKIHMPTGDFQAKIPLPGEHMVYNALAAAAVGEAMGLSTEEIKAGIAAVRPTAGRSNLIKGKDLVILDDCYNANPVSMCAALDLLAEADTRKIAILGDMFELGENEESLHGEVGRYAAKRAIDRILCVGKLSEKMAKEAERELRSALSGKSEVRHYAGKEELLSALGEIIKPGDTVLVKASHGMGFAEIVEKLKLY
ncbi:MAG: UDP-N-acetylmuramoyl-tripeptide--D-alanyl-D-alanine ligase [Lachnospiraceae bacterium]|nr:UDP-N-acetylmuramoyl-tripeptide--D-alanyl-D-alanine ligase [Lachnospiraceae bacterium]